MSLNCVTSLLHTQSRGIWFSMGTVLSGEVQMEMEAGKESRSHKLLVVLLQSVGNSIQLRKESGNQKVPCLQDRQRRGAVRLRIIHRREHGERIQMGFLKLSSAI